MATIRNWVNIYSNLLSNCSNDRFGFINHFFCELTQAQTGGVTGGLWEVLREVFQAYPFYNSLILRSLGKTTGGLGEKQEKGIFEDWKTTNPLCNFA